MGSFAKFPITYWLRARHELNSNALLQLSEHFDLKVECLHRSSCDGLRSAASELAALRGKQARRRVPEGAVRSVVVVVVAPAVDNATHVD